MNEKVEALEYLKERDYEEIVNILAEVESLEEDETRDLKPFQLAALEAVRRRAHEVFNEITENFNQEINALI